MKNVLIITASLRENSNSDALASAFLQGAKEVGCNVEIVSLKNKSIAYCKGCGTCATTHECAIKDDAIAITKKMYCADVIVFSSPVYYYSIAGQLKTLFDRSNSLYGRDYAFRKIYFLCTATENEDFTPQKSISTIQGWVDCFPNAKLCGTVFAGGVSAPNDIINQKHTALEAARNLGKSVLQ